MLQVNIQLINVNDCEQEIACWCEYLIIDYFFIYHLIAYNYSHSSLASEVSIFLIVYNG